MKSAWTTKKVLCVCWDALFITLSFYNASYSQVAQLSFKTCFECCVVLCPAQIQDIRAKEKI